MSNHNDTPSGMVEMIRVFAQIGCLSFGGPAAQIALMHRVLVEENKWLAEAQYLRALSFCMLLPGPEAMQLATYAGWKLRGMVGGLIAGLLFVLPGAVVMLLLALIYIQWGDRAWVVDIFFGIKAAVLAIVFQALFRISGRALTNRGHRVIAGLAFVGLFFFSVPYLLIIVAAAWLGAMFLPGQQRHDQGSRLPGGSTRKTLLTLVIGVTLWLLPVALLHVFYADTLLDEIGMFFSKLAVVTFGGAYAVLAYMSQVIVQELAWLGAGEMIDGLGLAETTPGPLILVTQFIGFLAAERAGGLTMGLAGMLVTLWVTFVPCFVWIFTGAPYIEWMTSQPRLNAALAAITAAVVGVMVNLSLWFSFHVLFGHLIEQRWGPVHFTMPEFSSIDATAGLLAIFSGIALLWWRWGVITVLTLAGMTGLVVPGIFAHAPLFAS